VGQTE